MHDGRIVLMDWATCQLAPIGSDLAKLFGHASAAVRDQPSVVRECLDAYAEAMSATLGAPPRRSQIKLGYRYQLIAHSFRKVLAGLPAPLTPGERASSRPPLRPDLQLRLEAHLVRLCDESDALLRQAIPKRRRRKRRHRSRRPK